MSEKMTNDEYLTIQHQLFTIGGLVADMNLDGFLLAIGRAEAAGPILDPTLYRAAQGNLGNIKRLAESLREFQQEVKQVAGKHAGCINGGDPGGQ